MENLAKSIVLVVSLVTLTARAGEVLRLNSGNIKAAEFTAMQPMTMSGSNQSQDYIVQFKKSVTEADKAALKAIGCEVFGYLPDDALVVRGQFARLSQLQAKGAINAVVAYLPQFKLSRNFSPSSIFNKGSFETVVIKTFKASELTDVVQKISNLNPEVLVQAAEGTSIAATIPRGVLEQVAAVRGVEHVQPYVQMQSMHFEATMDDNTDNPVTPSAGDYTDLAGDETGTRIMKFDAAYAKGYTGKGQIASMADTGLDTGDANTILPDFRGAIVDGAIFGMFSKSWGDPMGHGTHVAGSIVGRGTLSGGKLHGGAYDAGFVAEGMWSPMMKNLTVPSKLGDLFNKAYSSGARVHSNSWGAARNFGAYDNYAQQVDAWMFDNQDMLVLFAAGNSGVDMNKDGRIDPGSMSSPGTAKNCLTVGASENNTKTGGIQVPISKLRVAKDNWGAEPIFSSLVSDNENGVAMFSSRGPTNDSRIKPDVVAPGTNILSTRSTDKDASDLWGKYNDNYVWSGGTSMATPLAAGAVTIARQYVVEKVGIANPSAALMKALVMHTAVDMYPGQYGEVGAAKGQELVTRRPNSDEGYGRVDMSAIVNLSSATTLVDDRDGVAQDQEKAVTFDINGSGKTLLVNLVYTDAPASPNANQALVNDLDLVLTKPDGSQFRPQDHTNNAEVIELSGMASGHYTLSVKGTKVPQGKNGKQPYALIYTVK